MASEKATIIGILDSNVIGRTTDYKHILLINKKTGVVFNKILSPRPYAISLTVMDKYVLINDTALYKSKLL